MKGNQTVKLAAERKMLGKAENKNTQKKNTRYCVPE